MRRPYRRAPGLSWILASLLLSQAATLAAEPSNRPAAVTGKITEQRFPPLLLPAGFQATLFACDPLVEYPSVIALGPRQGSVYVAYDYMTGLGLEIVRRDEIRLVEDTDGDGYADRSTLFAEGFNSIQGLAYHANTVFAMHAPFLTALRDTDGDGLADERRDLHTGLGLPPENNPNRLHCANGVVVGADGWLYLALGDNGTKVLRPEGDRLILNAGGILRCRPDGRDLHVFSMGLRNIYDVALDEECNVFVRDNENDGGDYMIRVYHSFFGADHGYPYLYREKPALALAPLADLGRGSSAGCVCYLEEAFPREFRGLFCCEWGRSVVHYDRQPAGAGFAPMQEADFASAAATDPYGLKPTDIVVDRDGSLLVADWGDGQRPQRGRGRLYRITSTRTDHGVFVNQEPRDLAEAIQQLNSASYSARLAAQTWIVSRGGEGAAAMRTALARNEMTRLGRLHAAWIFVETQGVAALEDLFSLAEHDPDERVRAVAVRAIADVADPVFRARRLDAVDGDPIVAERLARLAKDPSSRVRLCLTVALGRLHWDGTHAWLRDNLAPNEPVLAHAAQQALRRQVDIPALLQLLEEADDRPIRAVALAALTDWADPRIVDALLDRLEHDSLLFHRLQYAELLTRVRNKPGTWTYWGYRPEPRSPNTESWDRTLPIEQALARILAEDNNDLRAGVLPFLVRERIPMRLDALADWLERDFEPSHASAILGALATFPAHEIRETLAALIREPKYSLDARRAALVQLVSGLDASSEPQLLELARAVEDGPVQVDLLRELARRTALDAKAHFLGRLDAPLVDVRASALDACARQQIREAAPWVQEFLQAVEDPLRLASAKAAGLLKLPETIPVLLALTDDPQPTIRAASLRSLLQLGEANAAAKALAVLDLPEARDDALAYLAEFGGPEMSGSLVGLAAKLRSVDALAGIVRTLAAWQARSAADVEVARTLEAAIAEVQGQSGLLMHWHVLGPFTSDEAQARRNELHGDAVPTASISRLGVDTDARIDVERPAADAGRTTWLAVTSLALPSATRAQFLGSANGLSSIWLNADLVRRGEKAMEFRVDAERFENDLIPGMNRVVLQVDDVPGPLTFHLRFRPFHSSQEQERLMTFVLGNSGDAERGRAIFQNAEKSLCIKCHRLGEQGGNVGPNLAGVGSRFSKIHLLESILEPSRTIAPSYETLTLVLNDGRLLSGVKIAEDATTFTLGDETGKRHEIPLQEIEERAFQRRSTMPEGLAKRLQDRELLDLVTFLLAEKRVPNP